GYAAGPGAGAMAASAPVSPMGGYPAGPSGQPGYSPQGYPQQHPPGDDDDPGRTAPALPMAGGYAGPSYTPQSQAVAVIQGTPGAMPATQGQPLNALAPIGAGAGQLGRTLMGAAPPPGLPSYSPTYPPQPAYPPTGQQPAYPSHQMPAQPGYGSQPPQLSQHPSMASMASGHYGQSPYGAAAELTVPVVPDGRTKRSSIARDVAIGVAIAALVLGGFLVVKFFVLDKQDDAGTAASSSTIATLRLAIPVGVAAELYVDDKKIATVGDKHEIPVNAGERKVKLVGPNGAGCEQVMKLPAGKVTTVECGMGVDTEAGSGAGAVTPLDTSAGSAGSAGSAADKAAAEKAAADKLKTDKTAAADKAAADKAAADQAAADKAAAEAKALKDKAAKDKAAAKDATVPKDKPKDRVPVDDNPIDRAAALPSKGTLKIVPPSGADILIDGAAPTGPIAKLALAPGKHKVTFVLGNDKHTFSVTVKAGETVTLDKKDLQ
ncbi:MAG: hypothetical protein M3680_23170, partial [Myxococcota bacterium]|nr:hypothetical protein [Myxococcota bacterium]